MKSINPNNEAPPCINTSNSNLSDDPNPTPPNPTTGSASPITSKQSDKRQWRPLLVLAGGALLCSLIVVEIIVRLMEPRFNDTMAQAKRHKNHHGERPLHYYIHSDSVSLRGNGQSSYFDSAAVRIAVVGDSFTFAPKMQADDAFPARLGRLLSLNRDAPRAAVLNLGTPGVSTFEEEPIVRGILRRRKPTLVILEVTLNDGQLRRLQEEPPEVRGNFGQYNPTGWKKLVGTYWHTLAFILARIHNQLSITSYINYHRRLFIDPKTRGIFEASLSTIARGCKRAGVPLAMVIFPLFDFPIDAHYPFSEIHQTITSISSSLGIPTLDLRRAYQGLDIKRLQLIPGADSHPNEIAHRIAAEALLNFLLRHSLVPHELQPRLRFPGRDNMRIPTTFKHT